MTNTSSSNQDLGRRIEQLVNEHIGAIRMSAQAAVERAFGSGGRAPAAVPRREKSSPGKKRASTEVAALGERFYKAVCAQPGETMMVLGAVVGASARELHRSVNLLKRAGRVRSVGNRCLTRYFPMTNGAAASA